MKDKIIEILKKHQAYKDINGEYPILSGSRYNLVAEEIQSLIDEEKAGLIKEIVKLRVEILTLKQKNIPAEINDIVNEHFWELLE